MRVPTTPANALALAVSGSRDTVATIWKPCTVPDTAAMSAGN